MCSTFCALFKRKLSVKPLKKIQITIYKGILALMAVKKILISSQNKSILFYDIFHENHSFIVPQKS